MSLVEPMEAKRKLASLALEIPLSQRLNSSSLSLRKTTNALNQKLSALVFRKITLKNNSGI